MEQRRRERSPPEDSELDRSGRAIVSLLQRAAQAARADEERAMLVARKLSAEVRAAEDRALELEAELSRSQERASRAEEWLLRVYKEIEVNFFDQNASVPGRKARQ